MRTNSTRWLFGTLAAATLIAAPAAAQVVVVVDDDPGNDSAYVDGVGGNFTGAGALVAAELAIEGDSLSSGTLFDINIIDTDGSPDTYTGSITFSDAADRSIRVEQIANGNGNDTSVTLVGQDGGVAFMAQGPGTVMKGISPAIPLIIEAGPPGIGTGTFAGGANARFENLLYQGPGALDHNDFGGDSTGSVVFQSCVFGIGNGPQIFRDGTTFEDCDFAGGGFKFVMLGNNMNAVTFNNCSFGPAAGGLHLGGSNSNFFLNNCSLNTGGARLLTAGVIGTNQTITFTDPISTGQCGDVMLGMEAAAGANPTVNIIGTDPANKVSLDGAFNNGTVLFARIYSGTINLVNVTATAPNAHIDDLGDPGTGDPVTVTMDGCYWPENNSSGTISLVNGADPPADPSRDVVITARNTIWAGGTPFTCYVDATRPHTGTTTVTLEHCTMQGSTGNVLVNGSGPVTATTELFSDYSLFDCRNTVAGAASGVDFIQGNRNLIVPGSLGGFLPGNGTDPLLVPVQSTDAAGRLIAGSQALENAINSMETVDFEGDARPSAMSTTPDIGADESDIEGETLQFGWPIQAVRIPGGGTAPTIDGVIDVAGEYSPTGAAVPTLVSLSTLEANDLYFPELTHTGTTLNVSGDFVSDGDGSMDCYFVYDDTNFYFGVLVRDEALLPNPNPGVNAGDAFQLCMDFDNNDATDVTLDGTGGYIPSFSPVTNSGDGMWFQQFWPTSAPNSFGGMQWAVQTSAEGYIVEACIPWSVINSGDSTYTPTNPFPPADGQVGGIMPLLDDHDGSAPSESIAFMYTSGGGANIIVNASQYNDLLFVETPTLPSSVQDWSMY